MVRTNQAGFHRILASVGETKGKDGPALFIGPGVQCPDGRFGAVGFFRGGGEIQQLHAGARTFSHGCHANIVGVQDGCSAGSQGLHHFALGTGNVFHAAEFTGVGCSHAQDDADVRLHHGGQVFDVADAGRPHLHDEVAGAVVRTENGQRNTHLSVVGAHGSHRFAFGPKDPGQQVLGGGFTGRTRDSDDRQRRGGPQPADDLRRKGAHGQDNVRHQDCRVHGSGGIRDRAFHQGQDGAALKGGFHEEVAVGVFAGFGDEEGPGRCFPGIGCGRVHDRPGCLCGSTDQFAARNCRYVCCAKFNHDVLGLYPVAGQHMESVPCQSLP